MNTKNLKIRRLFMKSILLAVISLLALSGCGEDRHSDPNGSTEVDYLFISLYNVELDGHLIQLADLDRLPLMVQSPISYLADNYQCFADAIMVKLAASSYRIELMNMTPANINDPLQVAACDLGAPSSFYITLTSIGTMNFVRAN